MTDLYYVPILDKRRKVVGKKQMVRLKPEVFKRYGHLVKSITPTSNEGFKIELYSAKEALELIGKYYSLFIDKDKEGNPIHPIVNVYIPNNDRT